jgi:3-oxoacyl-[acyl-carrier protein] reductase
MDFGLRDRVAIVEAASQGLGRAIAEALAQEGARLVLCSRSESKLEATREAIRRAYGTDVLGVVADVGKQEDVAQLVQAALDAYGRVDICIANGPGPPVKRFLEVELADWRLAIEMNLLSAAIIAREVLPIMERQEWGRLVVVSSIVAKQPVSGFVLSNAVRPGISGLVRTLADEFGQKNITVNAVLPGTFATDRLEKVSPRGAATADYERWINANSLHRLGRPAEFGSVVAFLCSERASFITGASIPVDGGFSRGLQ